MTTLPGLADNVKSGYAVIHTWAGLTASADSVKTAIQGAFDSRVTMAHKIDNSRLQMAINTCE